MELGIKKLSETIKWKPSLRYKILFFLLFFILFTLILTSELFVSKLNVELGEPSPELITAPWDKDIEDLSKYHEEQEAAADAVQPVFKPNEEYVASLAVDLSKVFLTLREEILSNEDREAKVEKLRKDVPFAAFPDGTLFSLLDLTPNQLEESERIANRIITSMLRDTDAGAKNQSDVPLLKDRLKSEINKTELPYSVKILLQTFVEIKINRPSLEIDEEATEELREEARASVKPEVLRYRAGEKIVGPGEIVDERIFQVLAHYGLIEIESPWKPAAGVALHVFASMVLLIIFAYQFHPDIFGKWKRLILIALSMLFVLILGKAILAINLGSDLSSLTAVLIPAAWATMTIAILLGMRIAIVVNIILAVFIGTMAEPSSFGADGTLAGFVALLGGLVGVQSVARLDQRSDLAKAGLFVAAANIILVTGISLIMELSITSWLIGCFLGVCNGFISSVLTMGTLPWFEAGFNITSAVRLLELSNPNSSLLKELLMEAPGTYHHSVLVGNLAETAAEEAKADPVVVRVGALYHDIGKLKRPYFFIENQFSKENPHEKIAPTLSALIITSHVKDGLEMAKEHKLPQSIQDIIVQHHGDSLVSFFYRKALEENPDISEETFRYDGIRPQTKEAALVLLADNVEAAVRSHKGNTPGRIEGLVRKVIKDKFDEGLLNQCDLTFRDLDKISTAFVKVLSGIFHSRVEYPELPSPKAIKAADEEAQAKEKEDYNKENREEESPEKGSKDKKNLEKPETKDDKTDIYDKFSD